MNIFLQIIIGLLVVIGAFYLINKTQIRVKLLNYLYKTLKNFSAMSLHIIAFMINFLGILGLGLLKNKFSTILFDVIAFPLLIVVILTFTTSIITVAKIKQSKKKQGN